MSYGPLFIRMHHLNRCPLSTSSSFDQNLMKLGHIVKYNDVFFKFDNGPYHTILTYQITVAYYSSPYRI